MGVGSAYLNLQSYGLTALGVVLVVGGGLGLAFFNEPAGKVFGGIVLLVGLGAFLTASKIRKEVKSGSDGYEGIGKVALGLVVLSAITKTVTALKTNPTLPNDVPQSDSNNEAGE
tara:strand:+ start:539 stop:883 length:345 start_codon:yes stop_codon:yes gene_type:complete